MSETFQRRDTPALTKIVDKTMNGSYGSYSAMKEELAKSLGMISPQAAIENAHADPFGEAQAAPTSVDPVSAPSYNGQHTHERVIYPHGNDRYVITGFSEEELAQKEARIRALYQ
jgi:hypothetical protein